jgi:hypothetical protein
LSLRELRNKRTVAEAGTSGQGGCLAPKAVLESVAEPGPLGWLAKLAAAVG